MPPRMAVSSSSWRRFSRVVAMRLLSSAAGGAPSAPVFVMAHGFTGTRRDRLGLFAECFAAAGIAAMPFDYRGFGDSTGAQDIVDIDGQLEDWRAAIAFARSL